MSGAPDRFNKPGVVHLGPDANDRLAHAILTLTKELCVLTDRVMVVESLISDRGDMNLADLVDKYQPGEALQSRIDDATARIIDGVIGDLSDRQA